MAELELPSCTELVAVGPFSHFQMNRFKELAKKKKKKSLQNAEICLCKNVLFFLSPEIFWVLHYPHLLAKVRHQEASGTVHLPIYSVDADVQHWWLVLCHFFYILIFQG